MATMLERARQRASGYFQRAQEATGFRERDPSVLDHARKQANDISGRAYAWVRQQSPWLADRIDDGVTMVSEMQRKGFGSGFESYHAMLLKPLKGGTTQLVRGVQSTMTCEAAQSPAVAFELWNALCFWLALVLLVVDLLLPFGFALAEISGAVSAYFSAYALHFIFIRSPQRLWMLVGLVVLGLYISVNLFTAFATVIVLVPAAIALARAGANAILLFHAHALFVQLEGGGAVDML